MAYDNKQSPLEQSILSGFFRKVAAPATLAAVLAGCLSPAGSRSLNKDEIDLRNEARKAQYSTDVGALATRNISEAHMTDDELASKGEIKSYITPAGFSDTAKGFTATSAEGQALVELNNANIYLSSLFSGAKIRRHALHSLKSNVDYEGFERYGKMSREDVEAVVDNLKELSTSLKRLTFERRETLTKMGNTDVDVMLDYNKRALNTLNDLFNSIADSETHKGHLDKVSDAQRYSASILKSTTGFDQYGTIETEGRGALNKLLEQKVRDVVSARTAFAKDYGWKEGMTLKDAYNDLLEKTYNEAIGWSDNSIEKICNVYLNKALEMSKEARKNNYLETKQFLAVNRVIAKDFLAKMGTAAQDGDKEEVHVLRDIVIPAMPGYSFVSLFLNLDALKNDTYSPDGKSAEEKLEHVLIDGNSINNGFQSRDYFPGSLAATRTRFYSAGVSSAMQIAAGVVLLVNKSNGGNGNGSSTSPATQSSGTDTITPGTGPR